MSFRGQRLKLWRNSHSHIRQTGIHLDLGKTYLFKEAHAVGEYVQVEGEFPPGRNEKCVTVNERTNRTDTDCWTAWHQVSFCSICFGWEKPSRTCQPHVEWLLNFWWVCDFVSQTLFSRCCSSSTLSPSCLLSAVWSCRSARQTAQHWTWLMTLLRFGVSTSPPVPWYIIGTTTTQRSRGPPGTQETASADVDADQSVPEPEGDAHK